MSDPAAQFRDSPRYPAIKGIFEKIKANAPTNDVWGHANKVMHGLNGIERNAMPELIKLELKKRDF